MLKNFWRIATRNLFKHKTFSLINIAGLSLGIAVCILITLFITDETQFDKFLPQGNQVYRVYNNYAGKNDTRLMAVTSPVYANLLKQDFAEVEQTARVMMLAEYKILFEAGGQKLYEDNGLFVDSTFLDVFKLPLVYGSLAKSLDEPNAIVISKKMSEKFFGNSNPVGQTIKMNQQLMQVKAVFPVNSKFHLQFDFLVPLSAIGYTIRPHEGLGMAAVLYLCKIEAGVR